MIIHDTEECQQWLNRRTYYPISTKTLLFEPEVNGKIRIVWDVADIGGKVFQHDIKRIKKNFNKICKNYPKAKQVLENIHIFMCPKPSTDTANACANSDFICYFGRSTQIPWCMTDYVTAHELGHSIQKELCNEFNDESKMRRYLELRNAPRDDVEAYDDEEEKRVIRVDYIFLHGDYKQRQKYQGTWDTNPQEWFAEDFRYLFGTDQGDKYWGLPIPLPDEKIKEFMLSL